ncbi:MAG TPA: DUF2914 domain-containing protein [Longimicrobiales bacterium]
MRTTLATVLLSLTAATTAAAQMAATPPATSAIQVTKAVVATGIENRTPVGTSETFPADVGTVYFFTVLEGDFGDVQIEHVWLRDGQEVARVPLHARGPRWRTWSSKRIPPEWAGTWIARVESGDGQVLSSVQFTVGS